MHRNRKCPPGQAVLPTENQVDIDDTTYPSLTPAYGAALPWGSQYSQTTHGVEFQPAEVCPRNFLIFDQTEDRSHIMYHPAIGHNFGYPSLGFNETPVFGNNERNFGKNVDREIPTPCSEDSDDINALLSLDDCDEYQRGSDEEDVSTARTHAYDGSSSPDTCSNYVRKTNKAECPPSFNPSLGGSSSNDGKRKKVRKMVKVLRGMVPGGDQMNTVAVLDEAVKYLKSMKMEAKKLGLGKSKNSP